MFQKNIQNRSETITTKRNKMYHERNSKFSCCFNDESNELSIFTGQLSSCQSNQQFKQNDIRLGRAWQLCPWTHSDVRLSLSHHKSQEYQVAQMVQRPHSGVQCCGPKANQVSGILWRGKQSDFNTQNFAWELWGMKD